MALMAFVVGAVFLASGCVSNGDDNGISRADVLDALQGGELAVNLALGFAEVRGKDVTQARAASDLAFDTVRDVLAVELNGTDKESLTGALEGIKVVVADVIKVCRAAGVPETRIELLETSIDGVYAVLDAVIRTLPEGTAYVIDTHSRTTGIVYAAAADRPCTRRGPWAACAASIC